MHSSARVLHTNDEPSGENVQPLEHVPCFMVTLGQFLLLGVDLVPTVSF